MKKYILCLFALLFSLNIFAQSSEEVLNNFDGDFDKYSKVANDSFIALSTSIGLTSIPIILYPISAYATSLSKEQKFNIELSAQVIAGASAVMMITSLIINQVYKNKAVKTLENKYEYQKIVDDDLIRSFYELDFGEHNYEN